MRCQSEARGDRKAVKIPFRHICAWKAFLFITYYVQIYRFFFFSGPTMIHCLGHNKSIVLEFLSKLGFFRSNLKLKLKYLKLNLNLKLKYGAHLQLFGVS